MPAETCCPAVTPTDLSWPNPADDWPLSALVVTAGESFAFIGGFRAEPGKNSRQVTSGATNGKRATVALQGRSSNRLDSGTTGNQAIPTRKTKIETFCLSLIVIYHHALTWRNRRSCVGHDRATTANQSRPAIVAYYCRLIVGQTLNHWLIVRAN